MSSLDEMIRWNWYAPLSSVAVELILQDWERKRMDDLSALGPWNGNAPRVALKTATTEHRFWVNVWPHAVGGGTYPTLEEANRASGKSQTRVGAVEVVVQMPGFAVAAGGLVVDVRGVAGGAFFSDQGAQGASEKTRTSELPTGVAGHVYPGLHQSGAHFLDGVDDFHWGGGRAGPENRRRPQDFASAKSLTQGGKATVAEFLAPLAKQMCDGRDRYELLGTELELVNAALADYLGDLLPKEGGMTITRLELLALKKLAVVSFAIANQFDDAGAKREQLALTSVLTDVISRAEKEKTHDRQPAL